MDLLERAALLDELSGALADTAGGGRVVLVAGEAGIGKSTLVRRFTERQATQARFLLGACDPLVTPRALGPLHDIAWQTAQRLRRQLRRRGHLRVPRGPSRATAANPARLTSRQVEVLGLLAESLTDAEIAARLSLSTKTVGHHVSALLAKLEVGSRRQAAAAARRLGVAPAKDGEPGGPS